MTWDTRLFLWGTIAFAVIFVGIPFLIAVYLIICMAKGDE